MQVDALDACLTQETPASARPCGPIHRLLCTLVDYHASAALLDRAVDAELPFGLPSVFELPFSALGLDIDFLDQEIELGHAYLGVAGAGTIGNGLLWAGRHLDLRGRLEIADDDEVDSGDLNCQIWFHKADIGAGKAERLAHHAQPFFPHLRANRACKPCRGARPGRGCSGWLERLVGAAGSGRGLSAHLTLLRPS